VALFQNLPAGFYQFTAQAVNHQEKGGRIQIQPGITLAQPVFLDYTLITVDWSVTPVTITDTYQVILNATFQTDVPTPRGGSSTDGCQAAHDGCQQCSV